MTKSVNQVSVEPIGGSQTSGADYELSPYQDAAPAYVEGTGKKEALEPEITAIPTPDNTSDNLDKTEDLDHIIVTGADAALHLLPLRDDGDPSLTFRGIILASCLSAFQAVMYQIYMVSHQAKHFV